MSNSLFITKPIWTGSTYAPKGEDFEAVAKMAVTNQYTGETDYVQTTGGVFTATCNGVTRTFNAQQRQNRFGQWEDYTIIPGSFIAGDTLEVSETASYNGVSYSSGTNTATTIAPRLEGKTVSPKSSTVSGDVTFNWYYTGGGEASKTEIRVYQNSAWSTVATLEGSGTSVTVPAGVLTAGTIKWYPLVYNSENVAGTYTIDTSFTYIAAPGMPNVTATASNKPLIEWYAAEQLAYELKLMQGSEELKSVTGFGSTASYQHGDYLPNGSYTAMVRVQNSYGLWSDWGEAYFTAADYAGEGLTMTVNVSGHIATVSVTSTRTPAAYILYRDGVPVQKVETTQRSCSFTDDMACGLVAYNVIMTTSGSGFYDAGEQTVSLAPQGVAIKPFGGSWVELQNSITDLRNTTTALTQTGSYRHFCGSDEPVLELSRYVDDVLTFDAAFTTAAEARAFERLLGKKVVVKEPGGRRYIGAILTASRTVTPFYVSYSCSIQNSAFDEAVTV